MDRLRSPLELTADFAYVRLHGPEGRYQGEYKREGLKEWCSLIEKCREQNKDVFCYFDNDQLAYAPKDAQTLKAMLQA